jgi:hypothetical protein
MSNIIKILSAVLDLNVDRRKKHGEAVRSMKCYIFQDIYCDMTT